jgi:NitT/TauT family transport system permease protein
MKSNRLVGVFAVFLLWWGINYFQLVDTFFLPSPLQTAKAFVVMLPNELWHDILATLSRTLSAFGIALFVGVPVGLVFGKTEKLYRSIEPIVDFLRSMPATALFPLFMLIFGIGDGSKIAVATFAAMLVIIFNTAYGVIHSSKTRTLAGKLLGASQWQIFKSITFWESLPQTFVGLRNGISLTLAIVVVTEMFIGTDVGVGRRIIDSQTVFNIPAMFAALLVAGILGYLMNHLLLLLERRMVHWTKT